jgi:uncharacterized protein (UPF0147 family)
MKKSISIGVESEKLSALEMYLGQKKLKLSDEVEKQIEVIYQKNVPKNIREFIEMKATTKLEKKPKKSAVDTSTNHSEQ